MGARVGVAVAIASLLLLGTAGCPGVENTITELEGACVTAEDDNLVVHARFNACLSSSCDTLESTRCELGLEDGVITVTGEAIVRSKKFGACTADCGLVDASCSLELPPGEYTIRGAGEDIVATHPLEESAGACEFF